MPSKTLVIVESPAKARKIQKFLGSDYIVKASFGHLFDLPSRKLGIDLNHDSYPMETQAIPGKQKVIKELKSACKKCASNVILAPDPDREGEAIGYYTALSLGLEPYKTPRISFQEITKDAIMSALKSPITLCENAVKAQMTRRALDRILGYKISPLVKKFTVTGNSAGRCQSPSLLLLDQKERDIAQYENKMGIRSKMVGSIKHEEESGQWEVVCDSLKSFPKMNWMNVQWKVSSVKKGKAITIQPPPPFITSSLLSSASSRLGYGTGRTKKMIQTMYEKGWITYIRTDSTTISKDAQKQIADYVKDELNMKVVSRGWTGKKSAHAQEAHECIRPTLIKRLPDDVDSEYKRLYELIWNRTVASQMEAAKSISVSIEVERKKTQKVRLVWKGSKSYCVKAGWKALDGEVEMKEESIPVPKKKNTIWLPTSIVVEEYITQAPRRYTDATFVSQLEKAGIGRPSTYATIVETIKARGYAEIRDVDGEKREVRIQNHKADGSKTPEETSVEVSVGKENKRLMLTELGKIVCEFLYPSMDDLLGIESTSSMETMLDNICNGKETYEEAIKRYWGNIQKTLTQIEETPEYQKMMKERKEKKASNMIELGTQKMNGKEYVIGIETTRYGPAVTRSLAKGKAVKKEYGNIPKGTNVREITLDDAISMLPLSLGTWKRKNVIGKVGQYGPYLQIGKDTYISIPQDVWDAGVDAKVAKTILESHENEQKHVASIKQRYESRVKDIKKGPKGWYAIMKPEKGKKRGKTISIGPTILDISVEDMEDKLN